MLDKISLEQFEEIVGTNAELTVMDGPNIELKIEQVIAASKKVDKGRPKDVRPNQWTVVLSGPEALQAPDGTYTMNFENIGVLDEVYVENKSDNPETQQFNEEQMEKDTESDAEQPEGSSEDQVLTDPTVNPMPEPGADPRVIYEIYFG